MSNEMGFGEDIWRITETDRDSQNYGRTFCLDFSFIDAPEIKGVCKRFTAGCYRTGKNSLSKLYTDLRNFRYFNAFAVRRGICSLREMDAETVTDFLAFLKGTISLQHKKPLSYRYQKKVLDGLKSLVGWCRVYEPESVPAREIFTGNEFIGTNDRLKIDYIPDDVVAQINQALKNEKNPYLRYGIIIMECTGMRKGDLLNLKCGCIRKHPVSGFMMQWHDHKAGREREPIPVPAECAEAVRKLDEETGPLRASAPEELQDYLMLHICGRRGSGYGKIQKIHPSTLKGWLGRFSQEHGIRDSSGEIYHLTPHHFRRTLGTDMLSKGIGIHVIQEVLGHSTPGVTKRFYSDVKDGERAETFRKVGVIGDIRQIGEEHFGNVTELEWFRLNREKSACLCDGYCTKPVAEGRICERLLKRQKCYSCSRYITTPEYLDAHREHLASLEKQVENGRIYGEHYIRHFLPVIEVLRVVIKELEAIKNGKNG